MHDSRSIAAFASDSGRARFGSGSARASSTCGRGRPRCWKPFYGLGTVSSMAYGLRWAMSIIFKRVGAPRGAAEN